MNRSLLVAQREFLENVRTKGFWIGIGMLPVMLLMVAAIPFLVESTREAKHYAVVDRSGWLLPVIEQQIAANDLAYFLATIRAYPERSELPRAFDEFNLVLEEMDEEQVHAIAYRILSHLEFSAAYDHVALPEDALDYIERYGRQIARWWTGLTPEARGTYAAPISSNQFVRVPVQADDPDSLNAAVQSGELFAYFVIGETPIESSNGSRYVSNNLTDRDLLNWFGGYVSRQIRKERLRQEDLSAEVAAWVNEPLTFEGIQVSTEGQEQEVETEDVARQWTPVVFVYLLWVSILINTQMLLTNTIEEKSNKLIEVLLSSISPLSLMAGKILGIAATGLAIILAWTVMAIGFFVVLPQLAGIELPIDITSVASDPWFLISFIVYFVLGYLLYAAILVGLGSVCNNLKEAQNLMLPVQLVQMVPIFVMVPIGRDPNGTLAQVLSYFPPLTPFVMMNRAAAPPTTTEYVVTTILLVLSIGVALWFAAKVFRIGILLTGKPPGIRQIFRWLRAPVAGHTPTTS